MLAAFSVVLIMDLCCKAQQYTRLRLEQNTSKRGVNQSERVEFLYWHNFYRRQVDSPTAADMIYLLYHRELELAALNWATGCNFNHGNFNFTRHQLDQRTGIGQNIAARIGGYNIQNAVFSWFNEGKDYSYENASCASGAKCGHYIQVAGAGVTHIGCAIVYCPQFTGSKIVKEDVYNIVCDYYPSGIKVKHVQKGNVLVPEMLNIYEDGEPCTACPDGYKICEDKLCRSSPSCQTLDENCVNPENTTTCLCDELQDLDNSSSQDKSISELQDLDKSSSKDTSISDSEQFIIAANISTTTFALVSKSQTTMTTMLTTKVFLLTVASYLIVEHILLSLKLISDPCKFL